MRTFGVIFYALILILIGVKLIVFAVALSFPALQQPASELINSYVFYFQSSFLGRLVLFFSGVLLVLVSFFFAQLILGKFQREKNIAFPTGAGEVTIALSAVEDLIRKISGIMPEVKELRPDVRATKKGNIIVELKVVLAQEANIPELTLRLQEITKAKIQDVLGLEGQIFIRIHVAKIVNVEEKDKRKNKEEPPTIPFSGFGRS